MTLSEKEVDIITEWLSEALNDNEFRLKICRMKAENIGRMDYSLNDVYRLNNKLKDFRDE